ncbi:PREDICTED: LOW QUALITY PROTEIN: EGF-like module-containing mucin-like hormone receptor-like 1 [Condylura cristata]|uniref:LOW QUALITY PROTEIN: EGF-like module-containing mucin-like hormone receptor-like 1 n=1 Tax=Condylura cristata TaxID=143302 RepID=UPI000334709D|nr:PREDICTED: LOW QUALITY PROTEIN: EGF-like module-containing mucin-like hormone receptor-like 1 [Condylura cristata]
MSDLRWSPASSATCVGILWLVDMLPQLCLAASVSSPHPAFYKNTNRTRYKCADTTKCPANSICTNTVGDYYCSCQQGFQASNGLQTFQDSSVECRDIDECSQKPSKCGANTSCKNLPGSYECSCLSGFASPTGSDRTPAKPGYLSCTDNNECLNGGICPEHSVCTNLLGSYTWSCLAGFAAHSSICEDVDECAQPEACPDNATCHNSFGSYSCTCNSGFESSSGKLSFQGPAEMCEDIDECLQTCLFNATCTNTPGSYFCACHPALQQAMDNDLHGPRNGIQRKTELFADVNECLQDPSRCGPNSVCTNEPGSYTCGCILGFRPNPEGSRVYGNFSCKQVPFKCKEDVLLDNEWVQQCQVEAAMESKHVSFCELLNTTLNVLDETCEKKTISLKESAEKFAPVLKQTSTWSNFTKEKISALATVLLKSVESTTLAAFLKPSANASQTIQLEYLDIESKVINQSCTEDHVNFHFKAKGNEMKIGCPTVEESGASGIIGVAFISFAGLESVLNESFFQYPQTFLAHSEKKLKMNSRVAGGVTTGEKKEGLTHPVIYTMENIEPKQKSETPICVFWSTHVNGGRWVPSGCSILEASETHTVCSCNQMANLAIIMASDELTMEFSLYIISYVGIIISLVCLILAIITFLLCRAIRHQNTYIHLHLCICLFLAKLLFLAGVDKTDNQVVCALIAGFLHYLFLASFFWMLVEAVMLFLMVRNLKVVNYFSSRNIKMLHLCAAGYGLPGLLVVISASVRPTGYGVHNRCWLKTEMGFTWSFLGPVCTIIVVNSFLLTWTLWILRQKLSSVNAEVSTLKDTRLLTVKAFAQLFILGCSWVLGIFQIGPLASAMAYLFTIINSLQGTFIFLIHCLLSRQVREEYKRWFTGVTKRSSQSQTSGILLSSAPSTSKTL